MEQYFKAEYWITVSNYIRQLDVRKLNDVEEDSFHHKISQLN